MGGFILLVVAWIRWGWCSRKTDGTPMNMPATAARLTTGALLKMGIEDVMDGGMENSPSCIEKQVSCL
jgi:hypothetical protein